MEKILYTKYSNERNPACAIVTQVLYNELGEKTVRKRAAGMAARAHIQEVAVLGELLGQMLQGTNLAVNQIKRITEDAVDFEYLSGDTLEAEIDMLLKKHEEEAAEYRLISYMDSIRVLAAQPFEETDAFRQVFGSYAWDKALFSMPVTDIDLIPANVMLQGTKGTIIDYEWTYRFPIPVEYVLYRIIFYFITNRTPQIAMNDEKLYQRYGIDPSLRDIFARMEIAFQAYIEGQHVPMRKMYDDIAQGVLDFDRLYANYQIMGPMDGSFDVQIFTAKQGDFRVEDSYVIHAGNGHYQGEFEIPEGMDSFRLDPNGLPCYVTLNRLSPKGSESARMHMDTNGYTADGVHYVFDTADAMFVCTGLEDGERCICVDMDVKTLEPETAGLMCQMTKESQQYKAQTEAEMTHLQNLLGLRDAELGEIKATKVWRAYQKYSRARQKLSRPGKAKTAAEAPQEAASPCQVICSVDQVKMVGGRAQIQGWSVGEDAEAGIRIVDMQGQPVAFSVDRLLRRDVNESLGLEDMNTASGFSLTIHEDCTEQYVQVIFKDGFGERAVDVDLGTAIKPKDYDAWMKQRIQQADQVQVSGDLPKLYVVVYDPKSFRYSVLEKSLAQGAYPYRVVSFNQLLTLEDPGDDVLILCAADVMRFEKHAMAHIGEGWQTGADFLYWDEDCYDPLEDIYYDPKFKPDFNIDLQRSTDYIGCGFAVRMGVLRQALTREVSIGRYDYYELILHCIEASEKIVHISEVLTHTCMTKEYTDWMQAHEKDISENGRRAVEAHCRRQNLCVEVQPTRNARVHQLKYIHKEKPLISVIIPNKDHTSDLDLCIRSIEERSTYKHIEYIIVENNSTEEETFAYYKKLEAACPRAKVIYYEGEFNFSRINNFGAKYASGSYYLLLNNDIEMINPEAIESMLGFCMREDVGIVGARLLYPDDTIQHAGVIVGLGGVAGHAFAGFPAAQDGYCNRIIAASDLSAVTAACLMIKKEIYEAVDGLTEQYKVAFNDIDFCLKVRELGKLVVYDPAAMLYHYESKSRGYEDTPEKVARFQSEIGAFMERWSDFLDKGDPYYNKNLTLDRQDFSLR